MPTVHVDSEPATDSDAWLDVIGILRLLCDFIPCMQASAEADEDVRTKAQSVARAVIQGYNASGVKHDCAPEEMPEHFAAIEANFQWLDAHRGWMDERLESDLRRALSGMAQDLADLLP